MNQEYKTPKELLDFVLEECGDMEYDYDYITQNNGIGNSISLRIFEGFDIERIYYAISLIKEQFNIKVKILEINYQVTEIQEGYLNKTEIEVLILPDIIKLPKLPITLNRLEFPKDDVEYKIELYNKGYGQKLKIQRYNIIYDEYYVDMVMNYELKDKDKLLDRLRELILEPINTPRRPQLLYE